MLLAFGVGSSYSQTRFQLSSDLVGQDRLGDQPSENISFSNSTPSQLDDEDAPLGNASEMSVPSIRGKNAKLSQNNRAVDSLGAVSSLEGDDLSTINIYGVGSAIDEITPSMAQLYADKVNSFIRTLTPSEIARISPSDFGKIPPSGIALLSLAQIRGITSAQIKAFTRDQITQLNSSQIKEFFGKLSEDDFDVIYSQISKRQVRDFVVRLSQPELKGLSMKQLGKLDVEVFSKLSNQQFSAFNADQITTFTTSQVNNFTDNQLYWSYIKLAPGLQRANFIRILNRDRLIAMIKFIPKSSYSQVFNDANPRVLASLINAVSDSEKIYLVDQLNGLMISEIFNELPEFIIPKLKPEQLAFLNKEQIVKASSLSSN